jgi:hypothetical protein
MLTILVSLCTPVVTMYKDQPCITKKAIVSHLMNCVGLRSIEDCPTAKPHMSVTHLLLVSPAANPEAAVMYMS